MISGPRTIPIKQQQLTENSFFVGQTHNLRFSTSLLYPDSTISNGETTRIPSVVNVYGVEYTERLLRQSHQRRTENQQAHRDENRAREQAKSASNMKMECEDAFHVVFNVIVSEEIPETLENGPVTPKTIDRIFILGAVTCIPFHFKEVITPLVPEPFMAHHEGFDYCE